MPTANKEQIEGRMTDALESFGADRDQIKRDATWESLDVDSLDLVELMQVVEEEFGVVIPNEQAAKLVTVGDAIEYVVAHGA